LLVLQIHLPGCSSLKEKRSRLKSLLARLHREFNISVAEMDYQDVWQDAVIACAMVSNENGQTQRALQRVSDWIDASWPDVFITDESIEML
jgi:hypothetical protein